MQVTTTTQNRAMDHDPYPTPLVQAERYTALADLYQQHGRRVTRWAARLAGPWLEVEDIVQEVFLVAYQQLPGFRGEALLSTWLFGITNNVVRHRRRKERLRHWLLGKASADPSLQVARPTPVEELERSQATSIVYRALDGMAEKYRTPFVLFELEGLSGQEIADLTGVHPTTLRVQLLRAREQFAQRLSALEAKRP